MGERPKLAEQDRMWWRRLKRDLRAAIRDDQEDLARHLSVEIGIDHLQFNRFPEKHFHFVCALIRNRSFIRSEAGSEIIHLLMLEWDKLSREQRRRLLIELECVYPKIRPKAWYLAFLISEFVGIYYRSEAAFRDAH